MDLQHLRASDGTGEAVLAHIQSVRTIGSTVLDLDNVDNWNTKCVVVTGTPNANGFISTAGMTIMYGHLNAGDFIIDGYAPGYSDNGNLTTEVAIVKMTTNWADTLVDIINLEHTDTGAHEHNTINPIGSVIPYAGRTAPTGWLLCDGSLVDRTTYANLFNVLCPSIGTFTITIASPGVATLNAHGLKTGDPVYLTTTGALPTGLAINTTYYAIRIDANTFRLATTLANAIAGTAINTTGSQSGVHTVRAAPYGIGNGTTTFGIPDMRSRMPIGQGPGQFVTTFAAADVNTGTEEITVPTNKSLITGQKVRLTTTGTLPTGLSLATDYWVIRVSDTVIKLASSLTNAVRDGGTAINLTAQGSGVNTITLLYTDRNLGDVGGEETHSLIDSDMPQTRIRSLAGDYWNQDTGGGLGGWAFNPAGANNGQKTTRVNGGEAAHNIMSPFTTLNYIIKT